MKQLAFPLIIICVAGTFAVVVLELLFGNWFSTDPWKRAERLHIIRARRVEFDVSALRGSPGAKAMYTRDRYGLRGPCQNPADIQILTVGGSTTDQRYISDGETFQDVLSNLLSADLHRRVCVSNAGVDGHTTFGHIASFHDWFPLIPGLRPKLVLLYIGINDAGFQFAPNGFDSRSDSGLGGRIHALIRERSALYNLARIAAGRMGNSAAYAAHGNKPPESREYVDSLPTPGVDQLIARNTASFESRLDEILALVHKSGAKAICVSQPHLFAREDHGPRKGLDSVFVFEKKTYNGLDYDESIRALDTVMRNVCTRDGFYIDIAAQPFAHGDFYDPVHMTPAGAARLGGYLHEAMREQGAVALLE